MKAVSSILIMMTPDPLDISFSNCFGRYKSIKLSSNVLVNKSKNEIIVLSFRGNVSVLIWTNRTKSNPEVHAKFFWNTNNIELKKKRSMNFGLNECFTRN